MTKTLCVIQARTGSTRLPNKVLKPICGKPMLEHLLERIKQARTLDKIVVATTTNPEDEAVAELAQSLGVESYQGSEEDVLDRYYQAAKKLGAKHIVRVTGDCPLMDPAVVDEVVGFYFENKDKYDYVSNVHPPTYPDGMDVEVFSLASLERVWTEAKLAEEREHVTPYFYNHPEIFRLGNVEYKENLANLRITVDNQEDFFVVSGVFKELYSKNENFGLKDILKLHRKNPEMFFANRHIKRKDV